MRVHHPRPHPLSEPVCPLSGHHPLPTRAAEPAPEYAVVSVLARLAARYCAGGPACRPDGHRADADEWLGYALLAAPENAPAGRTLPELLAEMGVRTVEDLASLLRMSRVDAAIEAVGFVSGIAATGSGVYSEVGLLEYIDSPASGWGLRRT